jgi:hypothetical protein
MSTLNSGLIRRNEILSQEARDLIDEAIAAGRVKVLQPSGADGNEVSRSTRENIARARRDFRKKNKEKNKG